MGSRRPPPFSLRLTFEERAKIEVDAAGMSLGGYIRSRLLDPDWIAPDLPRDFHPALIRASAVVVMPFGALFAMGSGMPDPIAKIVSA